MKLVYSIAVGLSIMALVNPMFGSARTVAYAKVIPHSKAVTMGMALLNAGMLTGVTEAYKQELAQRFEDCLTKSVVVGLEKVGGKLPILREPKRLFTRELSMALFPDKQSFCKVMSEIQEQTSRRVMNQERALNLLQAGKIQLGATGSYERLYFAAEELHVQLSQSCQNPAYEAYRAAFHALAKDLDAVLQKQYNLPSNEGFARLIADYKHVFGDSVNENLVAWLQARSC